MGEIEQDVMGVADVPSAALPGFAPEPVPVSASGAIANATVATLKAARELLSDPARWTQGALARDASGHVVNSFSGATSAVCFCSQGAVERLADSPVTDHRALSALLDTVLATTDYSDCSRELNAVAWFNDTRTHAEVLDLFDRTIARLESEAVHG